MFSCCLVAEQLFPGRKAYVLSQDEPLPNLLRLPGSQKKFTYWQQTSAAAPIGDPVLTRTAVSGGSQLTCC